MQDLDAIRTDVRIAYRHKQVVLELREDLEPAVHHTGAFKLVLVRAADVEDLHMHALERLKLVGNDRVDQRVGEQDEVEVLAI